MRKTLAVTTLCAFVIINSACAAKITGDQVISSLKKTFASVRDYKVDANLSVKGPAISINNMAMTVYFKKPNKLHVDSKGGPAIIPPGALFGDIADQVSKDTRAVYVKTEKKLGVDCDVVRLDAKDRSQSTTIWVDKKRHTLVATKDNGNFGLSSTWRYITVDGKYYMPVSISAEMAMPNGGDFHRGPRQAKPSGPQKAKMSITFSNYSINKGISDKVFDNKRNKK